MREASAGQDDDRFASPAAYAHYLAAMLEFYRGEVRAAADELRLAVIHDPDTPLLRVALAEAYARLSAFDRAEAELRELLARTPGHGPAHQLLGRVLAEQGQIPPATAAAHRAIALDPRDPGGHLLLIELSLDAGKEAAALAAAEALARELPLEARGFLKVARHYAERGESAHAERMLERAVERAPGDAEVWQMLARAREAQGKLEAAMAAHQKALERDPEDLETLFAVAKLLLRREDALGAGAYLDQAVAVAPQDGGVRIRVALAFLSAQRFDQAVRYLEEARGLSPDDPRPHYFTGVVRQQRAAKLDGARERERELRAAAAAFGAVPSSAELYAQAQVHLANCLTESGDAGRAVDLLRRAIGERPGESGYYTALTAALAKLGRVGEAVELLEKRLAVQTTPEMVDALASAYQKAGRLPEAIAVLRRALDTAPRDETLLFALGAMYEKSGRFEESIGQMRQVLAVNPQSAQAMNFIGYTLADKDMDLDEAERLVRRALELRPDNGAYVDSLGWILFKRGELERAVEQLERAESLMPDAVIAEHLGDVYGKLARRKDAAEAYRRALRVLDREPDAGVRRAVERKLRDLESPGGRGSAGGISR